MLTDAARTLLDNAIPYTNSKMLIACWATVIILGAMSLVFWRGKKTSYALGVLPLAIPPLVHVFSGLLARGLDFTIPFATPFHTRIVIDLIAAATACILIVVASQFLYDTKKGRTIFVICCSLFIVAFCAVLITTTMSQYAAAFI